jgi:hypothetical protein
MRAFAVVLVLTLVACSSVVGIEDVALEPLVVNGGFDAGNFSGWSTDKNGGAKIVRQDDGNSIAWVGAVYGDSALAQDITVPETGTTTLQSIVFLACADPTADRQGIFLFDANSNIIATLFSGCSDARAWTKVDADLTPFAGRKVTIFFFLENNEAPDSAMFVDDVTVTNQ